MELKKTEDSMLPYEESSNMIDGLWILYTLLVFERYETKFCRGRQNVGTSIWKFSKVNATLATKSTF